MLLHNQFTLQLPFCHTMTYWVRVLLLVCTGLTPVDDLYAQASPWPSTSRPLLIDDRFTTAPVNDRMLIYQGPISPEPFLQSSRGARRAGFRLNTDPQTVLLGRAYAHPQAWVYLPLINATDGVRQLVIELDHNRCDTLDAYLVRAHQPTPVHLGHLFRTLPLAQRPIPRRTFALPFALMPHDSASLVLYSRRTTGVHELPITLSTEPQFVIWQEQESISRLFALSSACFFMFTVFSLGLVFRHRLLVCFGVYASSLVLGQLNYNYFFDRFPFPAWLGLNANSVGLFILFSANASFHYFGVAYLASLRLNRRWHRYMVGLLVGANLMAMGTLLVPLTPLTNVWVTSVSLLLTTLNIFWLFYVSLLGFSVKREKYLLITATLVFVPLLYKTYGQSTPALSYTYFHPFYYLLLFGFLIVALLRRELSSRQLTEATIQRVQAEINSLRQTEIEQLGRNLHDQLGNTLASVLGYLTLTLPNVALAKTMLLTAINETRLISHNLVKDDDRPLGDKLAELAERFNDLSPISFAYHDFTGQQLDRLPLLKQQGIYMIVQEALHNVVKHAQASEVTIQTFLTDGVVRVSVEDDGIGYVTDQERDGIGITNMHRRAKLAALALTMDSGRGGTLVTIETPLLD